MRLALILMLLALPLEARPTRAQQMWASMVASGEVRLSRKTVLLKRVRLVGAPLGKASRRPIRWDFYVLVESRPNAFSTGEGVVAVTEGLLALGLDDDELAGILAHEIAHGARQHVERAYLADERTRQVDSEKALLEESKQSAVRRMNAIQLDSSPSERAQEELARLSWREKSRESDWRRQERLNQGRERFRIAFNHEQEIEADTVAVGYLAQAGYRPDGLLRALEKMQRAGLDGLELTHPSLARRQQVLHRVLRRYR